MPISPSKKTELEAREATIAGSDQRLRLRLRLKLFTERQLKDKSIQIFGALTENALSAMTRDV